MKDAKQVIIDTLNGYGPANSLQLADMLGDYGIAAALRELEESDILYRHPVDGTWYLREWDSDPDPGDMDGDVASALASVGWGIDEDYGYCGDE